MGRWVVGYEGRDTADGRLIEIGALQPASPRIPILFEFHHDPHYQMGWAEDFQRVLAPEGWNEISFELYFVDNWENKVRNEKLTPTCAMSAGLARVPYDRPEDLDKTIISSASITAVGFSVGPNAWGEYPK